MGWCPSARAGPHGSAVASARLRRPASRVPLQERASLRETGGAGGTGPAGCGWRAVLLAMGRFGESEGDRGHAEPGSSLPGSVADHAVRARGNALTVLLA